MRKAKLYIRIVFLKKLREIQALSAFIRLLIKINSADAVLIIFNIRRDIHHKVITAHIAQ
jgi:hypothetical protein